MREKGKGPEYLTKGPNTILTCPREIVSALVSRDARKGQEKGNILDVAALRNAEASKALNSQHLIEICIRVCATDPLVLPRWWIDHARCAQRGG